MATNQQYLWGYKKLFSWTNATHAGLSFKRKAFTHTGEVLYHNQKKLNASKYSENLLISIRSADTSLAAVTLPPRAHNLEQTLFTASSRWIFPRSVFALREAQAVIYRCQSCAAWSGSWGAGPPRTRPRQGWSPPTSAPCGQSCGWCSACQTLPERTQQCCQNTLDVSFRARQVTT